MSMNCIEFRRCIVVQPRALDARARQHRDECARCAEAHAQALAFESLLDRSLAIPVPAALADRILLQQTLQTRVRSEGRRALIWRIAASVAIAVGVAGVSWLAIGPQQTLAAMSLRHLGHEPMALTTPGVLAGVEVNRIFQRLDVHLQQSPGDISYLRICPLGLLRTPALHMVMPQAEGAVTVIYVPGARSARGEFEADGILGRELTLADGVLLMMASSRHNFDAIEQAFRAAL